MLFNSFILYFDPIPIVNISMGGFTRSDFKRSAWKRELDMYKSELLRASSG